MTRAVAIPPDWSTDRLLAAVVGTPIAVHSGEDAIVIEHTVHRGRGFLGLGRPGGIASLLPRTEPETFVHGWMVRGTWEKVDPAFRTRFDLPLAEDWDWMDIDFVPSAPGSDRVRELDPGRERGLIDRVRRLAIPDSFLDLDNPAARWFGWADDEGVIRGIGGALGSRERTWRNGAHFASIGTEPAWQGRGVGSALTSGMVEIAFTEGAREASLGVYVGNARAIEVYRRLGFTTRYQVHSRRRA